MSTVESIAGAVDIERAARGEWLSWSRMADYEEHAPPVLVGGDGPYLVEADGTRLLDGMSGLFTTQIGYSHGKELGEAAAAQLEKLGFYPNWAATNPATLALTERVLGLAPEQMRRVFFTSGGSEAVESAWKLVRQHFLASGQPQRRKIIARRGAYHGCSLGALALTGVPSAREPFEPLSGDVRHVENTDRRNWFGMDDEGYAAACAEAVDRAIRAEGPSTVAAVVLEPVQNAGGCLTPPPGYAERLREICDHHGVLLWCDEVITGFGRLGEWFGSTRLGFAPDVITFAKGITSGFAPLGGVLFTDAIAEPLVDHKDVYWHGYTFAGHPVSCAIALRNLEIMERLDVAGNVRALEGHLATRLDEAAASAPVAVEARGAGFFRTIELVEPGLVDKARVAIRRRGVVVRSDVRVNPCLAISPPLICTREQIDELADGIAAGLRDVS
jgi:adenosylmethionine-8-amino-7-oxononanoate aminotransferase